MIITLMFLDYILSINGIRFFSDSHLLRGCKKRLPIPDNPLNSMTDTQVYPYS